MQLTRKDVNTNLSIEIFIKKIQENDYILVEQKKLLPSWNVNPQTLIIFLFQCSIDLDGSNGELEKLEKDRLFYLFEDISNNIYDKCKTSNILLEVISPKDGFPRYSEKGVDFFSLPLIVSRYISNIKRVGSCCGLSYSKWGKAVYPCLMLSSDLGENILSLF